MMKEQGEAFDPKSYLPAITGYYSTSKGEMLSFPFNSSSMVMWVNLDALKQAGIAGNRRRPGRKYSPTPRSCMRRHPTCGFSLSWITWGLIEQFSAWHNVPIGTKANGLDGFDTVLEFNTPLEIKLLENLVELQKDKSFDYSGRTNTGEGRFTSGECPLYMTSSAFYPNVKANAKFGYTAVPMPYFPDVKGAPQNSIIGGASLWVMAGKTADGIQRHRQILHLPVGYRPPGLSARGVRLSADHQGGIRKDQGLGLLQGEPDPRGAAKELTNKPPTENSRGLRFGGMVQMRDVWSEEIEAALAGKKSAKDALDAAVSRGNQMLRQFERTVAK